ncbi:hypothetical protein QO012_001311 [Methylobacterium aerolatum]|uniref:Transposase n=1 Tax=Methylobacterium aerolatum TaxID=418708 RepID=A0ABU0HWW8_9HYPH|nr:hypothetical protein [Methylobacterium aerolatum]
MTADASARGIGAGEFRLAAVAQNLKQLAKLTPMPQPSPA